MLKQGNTMSACHQNTAHALMASSVQLEGMPRLLPEVGGVDCDSLDRLGSPQKGAEHHQDVHSPDAVPVQIYDGQSRALLAIRNVLVWVGSQSANPKLGRQCLRPV